MNVTSMFDRLYQDLGSLFPKQMLASTQQLMAQAGIERISARYHLGFVLFFSTALALIAYFITRFVTVVDVAPPVVAVIAFFFTGLLFYLLLVMSAESRARQIEVVLPDALQIISSNMRAGMTLENAIWSSARPEFGPLREEINRVSSDVFGGVQISQGLLSMSTRVRSPILARAMKLVVEGINLGGEMSHLLEEVAHDIRSIQLLHKEIATTTLTYAIFIVFAAVLAAPLLFSISTFYAQMNQQLSAQQVQQSSGGTDFNTAAQRAGIGGLASIGSLGSTKSASSGGITANDIYWFSLAAIVITTLFASLILGEIQSGSITQGLKYVPIFVTVAVLVYLGALSVLSAALGSLLH